MQYFYFNNQCTAEPIKRVIAFDVKLTHLVPKSSLRIQCQRAVYRHALRGDKLLFGHVPDPFPRCGHARLISTRI